MTEPEADQPDSQERRLFQKLVEGRLKYVTDQQWRKLENDADLRMRLWKFASAFHRWQTVDNDTICDSIRIEKRFGFICQANSGGMGEIFLMLDADLSNRLTAIKVELPESNIDPKYFDCEASTQSQLEDYDVIPVFHRGTLDYQGKPCRYFAMRYIAGATLAEFLDESSLDVNQRLMVFQRLAENAARIHERGIVHRDLKPDNVLVRWKTGVPKLDSSHDKNLSLYLIDFGLSQTLETEQDPYSNDISGSGTLGSWGYMSPEVACGDARFADPASDVYALGSMLLELLTGCRPLTDRQIGQFKEDHETLKAANEKIRKLRDQNRTQDEKRTQEIRKAQNELGEMRIEFRERRRPAYVIAYDASEILLSSRAVPGHAGQLVGRGWFSLPFRSQNAEEVLASRCARSGMDAVIRKSLDRDPTKRYPNGGEFANALNRVIEGKADQREGVTKHQQRLNWSGHNPAMAGLLAISILVATSIACLLIGRNIYDYIGRQNLNARVETVLLPLEETIGQLNSDRENRQQWLTRQLQPATWDQRITDATNQQTELLAIVDHSPFAVHLANQQRMQQVQNRLGELDQDRVLFHQIQDQIYLDFYVNHNRRRVGSAPFTGTRFDKLAAFKKFLIKHPDIHPFNHDAERVIATLSKRPDRWLWVPLFDQLQMEFLPNRDEQTIAVAKKLAKISNAIDSQPNAVKIRTVLSAANISRDDCTALLRKRETFLQPTTLLRPLANCLAMHVESFYAEELLSRATQLQPDNFYAWIVYGINSRSAATEQPEINSSSAATEQLAYTAATALRPDDDLANANLSAFYGEQLIMLANKTTLLPRELRTARRHFDAAIHLNSIALKTDRSFFRASANYNRGRYLEAFQAILEANEASFEPLSFPSKQQLQTERKQLQPQTIECYQRALKLDPDLVAAENNLGTIWQARNEWQNAIECYRRVIAKHPEHFHSRYNLGYCLIRIGEFNEAEQQLESAHRLKPDHPLPLGELASLMERESKTDRAIEYHQRALAIYESSTMPFAVERKEVMIKHHQRRLRELSSIGMLNLFGW